MPIDSLPMPMLPALIAATQPGTAATAGLPLWASALMVILGAGLFAMVALHLKNARRGTTSPSAAASTPRPASSAPAAPHPTGPTPQLARELDELGKRLADELDSRADRLEKLIADADDRLARLERLTAASVHIAPESAAALTEVKRFNPSTPGDSAHTPPTDPAAPNSAPRSAAAVMAEIDPLAGEIYKLADSGLLPVQIAQKLSQHTGKVELLLALRRG